MLRILKWIGIILGILVGLIVLVILGLYGSTTWQINKTHTVKVEALQIPSDAASIARGEAWVKSECMHCHGENLAGKTIFEDPKIGKVSALNLTPGKGGAGSEFTDEDWVRAIRYGVNPEGHTLIIMPASDFNHFSDQDLGDIIAYVKSVPPVDGEWPDPEFTPMAKVLVAAGAFGKIMQAEIIDPSAPRPETPPAGVTAAYGEYIVNVSGCKTCHHPNLAGGKVPNPQSPKSRNLTPGGELVGWELTDFMQTIRTGTTPSGHKIDPEFMPWSDFRNMSDDQLNAIWLYLKSLPATPTNPK